jgi:hypothetical protein
MGSRGPQRCRQRHGRPPERPPGVDGCRWRTTRAAAGGARGSDMPSWRRWRSGILAGRSEGDVRHGSEISSRLCRALTADWRSRGLRGGRSSSWSTVTSRSDWTACGSSSTTGGPCWTPGWCWLGTHAGRLGIEASAGCPVRLRRDRPGAAKRRAQGDGSAVRDGARRGQPSRTARCCGQAGRDGCWAAGCRRPRRSRRFCGRSLSGACVGSMRCLGRR